MPKFGKPISVVSGLGTGEQVADLVVRGPCTIVSIAIKNNQAAEGVETAEIFFYNYDVTGIAWASREQPALLKGGYAVGEGTPLVYDKPFEVGDEVISITGLVTHQVSTEHYLVVLIKR